MYPFPQIDIVLFGIRYKKKCLSTVYIFVTLALFTSVHSAWAQQLSDVLRELNTTTDYSFSYREALVSGIRLSERPNETNWQERLPKLLAEHRLRLHLDEKRRLAFILEKPLPKLSTQVNLSFIDASTGQALPYVSVTWQTQSGLSGRASDPQGQLMLDRQEIDGKTLRASFVGYTSVSIQIPKNVETLHIRLRPETLAGNSILVQDRMFLNENDTLSSYWMNLKQKNVAGDPNLIRSLESFPSVSPVVGLNNGLSVRGSNPDALSVFLDGARIFNQSHLFGLMDAFHSEAIRSAAFYFEETPAEIAGFPGGSLLLQTRNGSQQKTGGGVSLSNTSLGALFETPLRDGAASLLIGGRISHLGRSNLLGSSDLVSWGLDVDRDHSAFPRQASSIDELLLQNRKQDVFFHDVHAKFYSERKNGHFSISLYSGGDYAEEKADRLFQVSNRIRFNERFRPFPVSTLNRWNNVVAGTKWFRRLSQRDFLTLETGFSGYDSRFKKDDFNYLIAADQQSNRTRIDTFANKNQLSEASLRLFYERLQLQQKARFKIGAVFLRRDLQYNEDNARRNQEVRFENQATQIDLFGDAELNPTQEITLNVGTRLHYYSQGQSLNLSPRLRIQYTPGSRLQIQAGFSRYFQYIHRFSITQTTIADVWTLADSNEGPTRSNNGHVGYTLKLWNGALFKQNAYFKNADRVRLHEIASILHIGQLDNQPRFSENELRSKGLESTLSQQWNTLRWDASYVWSQAEIRSPRFNTDWQAADWDRHHRFTTQLNWQLKPWVALQISQIWASAAPNNLFFPNTGLNPQSILRQERGRLSGYTRTDLTLNFLFTKGRMRLESDIAFFNLLDQNNVWYRSAEVILEPDSFGRPNFGVAIVDVYDLGFRPSISLRLRL